MNRSVFSVLSIGMTAILGSCTTSKIQVNRAALVPAPQPILFSPNSGQVELTVSSAYVTGDPTLSDSSAGLQAATNVFGGSLEALGRYVTGRYTCALASASGSQKLYEHQPVTEEDAGACGPMVTVRTAEMNGLRIHVGTGFMVWKLPVLEYEQWNGQQGSAYGIEQFSNTRALGSFGMGATYRSGRLTSRASFNATSQFYVKRTSSYEGYYEFDGNEVSRRGALVLAAGVGYEVAPNVRLGLDLATEVIGNPVRWGPQAVFHLAVAMGKRKPRSTHGAHGTPAAPPPAAPAPTTWGAPGQTPPI